MITPLIDVCTTCFANCAYCLHHARKMSVPRSMEPETFLRLLRILKSDGIKGIHMFLSGEPMLLRDRFYDYLGYCKNHGLAVDVATRVPIRIDAQRMKDVAYKAGPKVKFRVSVDNAPGIPTVVNNLDPEIVWNNLKMLGAIKSQYFKAEALTVVTKVNESNLFKIKNACRDLGISWSATPVGYYMGELATESELKVMDSLRPLNPKWCRFGKLFFDKYYQRWAFVKSRLRECGSRLGPVISTEGDVTICCHDMLFKEAVGNVFKTGSLLKLMKSVEYKEKSAMGKKRRLNMCKGCN